MGAQDPLCELAELLNRNVAIPLWIAVACDDMQPLWDSCRDGTAMVSVLSVTDSDAAARVALACVRTVLWLVPGNEDRPHRTIEACEAYIDHHEDIIETAGAVNACADFHIKIMGDARVTGDENFVLSAVLGAVCSASLSCGVAAQGPCNPGNSSFYAVDCAANAIVSHEIGMKIPRGNMLLATDQMHAKRECLSKFADLVRGIAPAAPKIVNVVSRARK